MSHSAYVLALAAMMHEYFKMGKVSCRIISNASFFMCKIHVPAISIHVPTVSMLYLGIIAQRATNLHKKTFFSAMAPIASLHWTSTNHLK